MVFLWLSRGVLLKPSPSPISSSGDPEVLIHVQKSELQGFTSCSQQTCKALHHTETLQIQDKVFGFQGRAPSMGTLLIPALVSQISALWSWEIKATRQEKLSCEAEQTPEGSILPLLWIFLFSLTSPKFYNQVAQSILIQWIFFFSIQNKFRVTLFFKENFWKKLHFKLLLNTGQAIPHLHNETYGGLNILGKKKTPTNTRLWQRCFLRYFSKEDVLKENVHGLKTSNSGYSFQAELNQIEMDIHKP